MLDTPNRPSFPTPNNPPPKATGRKPHRKTRTGCRTCKQRKIKCDEKRPSCNNCLKHLVECDFLFSTAPTAPNEMALSYANSPHERAQTPTFKSNPDPTLDLASLQLLHNFTASTSGTLHSDPTMTSLWKINVPEVGFEHDFVMHGILAISAQHLAHYSNSMHRRGHFIHLASVHHQHGLRVASALVSNITPQNSHAIYIFSAITIFYTLATPRKPGDMLLIDENGLADWLFLVRGTNAVINNSQQTLVSGPLGPMFTVGYRRNILREQYLRELTTATDPLYDLESRIRINTTVKDTILILLSAIQSLRKSFAYLSFPNLPGSESSDMFTWILDVSDEFLDLLKRFDQGALCVFAFFCVVMKRLDGYWWMQGWTVYLLERIWGLLDGEHRLWVRWPVEEIGWIPPVQRVGDEQERGI